MTLGKIKWKYTKSFCTSNEGSEFFDIHDPVSNHRSLKQQLNSANLFLMLRGLLKMDGREKEGESTVGCDDGTALVQCVERFFKNPQQNYEVPLQLLQEWFSDTSVGRRQELAKMLLALLEEQGLDIEQVTAPQYDSNKPQVFTETEDPSQGKGLEDMIVDSQMTDDNGMIPETSSQRWANQAFISDPIVLKSLREFRPVAVKPKQDTFLDTVSRTMQFNKLTNDVDEMMVTVVGEELGIGKQGETAVFANPDLNLLNGNSCPSSYNLAVGQSADFLVASKEKRTRSVGTSTFKEWAVMSKYSSEPSLLYADSSINTKRNGGRTLRKSVSLPSMRFLDYVPLPPLAPIVPAPRCNAATTEKPKPVEFKLTLVNSNSHPSTPPAVNKPITTFVEMSHAEFIKRQMLLNERVSLRHGIRLGGQIVCVPELVSCSAPHVDKPAPPLLLHSNVDLKRTRPVEMKLPERIVVSQSTSSHTIHYTPTTNHIASTPSHFSADKCSVVYVRESLTPVPATPTWQEQARMKPIIAYAKRKPSEIILTDNMKVVIAPNRVLNQAEQIKLVQPAKPTEREVVQMPAAERDVFVKRVNDDEMSPVNVLPTETAKPTLPKFNQTFVHNFQLKSVQPVPEPILADELDLNRKLSKKLNSSFSPVQHIPSEPALIAEEQLQVTPESSRCGTTGVIHSTLSVPHSPVIVERAVQVKAVQNVPVPPQVGLLIYTQGSSDEASAVPTLLLTTLSNGAAYCVRLPTNAAIAPISSTPTQIDTRSIVMQASLAGPVTVKPQLKKPGTLPISPPVESNKVALLKDLKEFENVFEETKLKFEKEKQLNVGEIDSPVQKGHIVSPQPLPLSPVPVPKLDCDKVVVGVKRKPECELPVLTRLYTTAKKPVIVVANYAQATVPPPIRPIVAQTCTAVAHIQNKALKGKSRSGKTYPNPSKSPPATKPQQKPQEDEKTQQKIFAILEEYAVQKEHSPDTNNRPAPRRRSNPPSATASKKKRPILKGSKDSGGETEDGSFSEM